MSEWKSVKLGEVIQINPDSISRDYPHHRIEYVDISSVGTGILNDTTTTLLKDAPSRARRLVRNEDTILSTVRPNRRSFWYVKDCPQNMVVSTGFAVLRAKDKIHPRFLYFLISDHNFTNYLVANEQGAAYPAVNAETISNADVSLPSYETQIGISSVLGSLEDKIGLNFKMNQTLEKMAITLYKHLFKNGDVKCKVSELLNINPRISVKKGEEVKFVDMKAIPTDSCSVQYQDIHNKHYSSGTKFNNGDILFARITPCLQNGKTAIVDFLDEEEIGVGSTEFLVLRPTDLACSNYIYCLSRDEAFRKHAEQSMVGTSGRQRVQNQSILDYEVPKPDKEAMVKFQKVTTEWFKLIKRNTLANFHLMKTRDYILPLLLKGELDLSEAAEKVREVISDEQPKPSI